MKASQSVLLAADGYLSAISFLKYLGVYENMPAWTIEYTEPVTIGYPVVFLLNGDSVRTVYDEEVFSILNELRKNKTRSNHKINIYHVGWRFRTFVISELFM